MATLAYQPPGKSRATKPEEIAERFQSQLIESTRRTLAMKGHAPGTIFRWRRAAATGPNSELAVIFIWPPGEPPRNEVWPYKKIEELAARVTDEEVRAELLRRLEPPTADS